MSKEKKEKKRKTLESGFEDVDMADGPAAKVKRGVKEVVKGIRKGEKGILILAADISPMDIISHLPGLSEEYKVPYVFVASKEELGHASATKRPTSCVMICPNMKRKVQSKPADKMDDEDDSDDYRELYDEIREELYTI
ncbi:SubName: Full=Probable NHP2-nucleolar rRNA processing protein {ECO:0000313/EMBL:CCA74907.1} [Serendipita indica DSM 11827]|nr:SubName: Full=Probable NHP2-nucleolar rRNA processing protein {ECO:0000313/EMBL:CCA74907.1} [Serendipita indica DSM 11827]